MFPDELDLRKKYCSELRTPIAYILELVSRSILIFDKQLELSEKLDIGTLVTANSLYVRSCRMLRQAAFLGELGQADGIDVLARSLFDGALSLAFVCREDVDIKEGFNGKYLHLLAQPLARKFRAALYIAHGDLKYERFLANRRTLWPNFPEEPLTTPEPGNAKELIGPEWIEVLRNRNTCSGLQISQLSKCLGFESWYQTHYALHSATSHGSEPDRYITFPNGIQNAPLAHFHSEIQEVRRSLKVAAGAFAIGQGEYSRLLDKSHQEYVESNLFSDGLKELEAVFDNNTLPPWFSCQWPAGNFSS